MGTRIRNIFFVMLAAGLSAFLVLHSFQAVSASPDGDLSYTLQGRVYDGVVGDESTPFEGVTIELSGGSNPYSDPGSVFITTTTNAEGWYGFTIDSDLPYEYYHIRQIDLEGYDSQGATSVDGTVRDDNWIEFVIPLESQDLTGNKFWDQEQGSYEGPDLVITGAWIEGSHLCYQGENFGDETVTAGHVTELLVDEVFADTHTVDLPTDPGSAWSACFDAAWSCSDGWDDITITADYADAIIESDETNNAWYDQWICDSTPPEITYGPYVTTTSSTTLIYWETSGPSNSRAIYGTHMGENFPEVIEIPFTTTHEILLADLLPSTSYHYSVESVDSAGNSVSSRTNYFETEAVEDVELPVVNLNFPPTITSTVTITAEVADNLGVDRVNFYLTDTLIFTDYSPPFTCTLDSDLYPNGVVDITAEAFDLAGNPNDAVGIADINNVHDMSAPNVEITSPENEETVSGIVPVKATLWDDTGIISTRFYVDGDYQQYKSYGITNPPTIAGVTFDWDTRQLDNYQQYDIAIETYDKEGKVGYDLIELTVNNNIPPPPSPPKIEITNQLVIRDGNTFIIALVAKNTGGQTASKVMIRHGMRGFQPIEETLGNANVYSRYDPAGEYAHAKIMATGDIPPGESRLYTYYAIPYLKHPNPATPTIGYFINLEWKNSAQTQIYYGYQTLPVGKTLGGETIPQAHAIAVKTADYLLVTNPYRLFAYYAPHYYQYYSSNANHCNEVLSSMAGLASLKQGVLGYNYVYTSESLRDLTKKGGSWSSKLAPGWDNGGYMMLVGEVQVLPAWWRYYGTRLTTRGEIPIITSYTDFPFASTTGDERRPELSVGRMLGNYPSDINKYLQTHINLARGTNGYNFSGLSKFVVSGFNAAMSGGADSINFKGEVDKVIKQMTGSIVGMHTPNSAVYWPTGMINVDATTYAITTTFFANTFNKDIIFLAGHGNSGGWDAISAQSLIQHAKPFGSYNPFVFASSCSTAEYPSGFSYAEAMLDRYAGAYLGAVNFGLCPPGKPCLNSDVFFSNWSTGKAFGDALKDTRNKLPLNSFFNRYWIGLYNLFGDPKFGDAGTTPALSTDASTSPSGTFMVYVPDYEMDTDPVGDVITIPGGMEQFENGQPLLPFYPVIYVYPVNTQVQDVVITSKGDPSFIYDLYLPDNGLAIAGYPAVPADIDVHSGEWLPGTDLAWETYTDGENTYLIVSLYPLQYNREAMVGAFTQDFTLDIQTTESPAEIVSVETSQYTYVPEDTVSVEIILDYHHTESMDAVVSAVIQESGSGTFVSGVQVRHVKDLQGRASIELTWPTPDHEQTAYTVAVELRQPNGTLLDTGFAEFQLGIKHMLLYGIFGVPEEIDPGDTVNMNVEVHNLGTVPLTPTLVVRAQHSTQSDVEVFTVELPEMTPGDDASLIPIVWDTSGAPSGSYHLISYLFYDGQTSEPFSLPLTIRHEVFLPFTRE